MARSVILRPYQARAREAGKRLYREGARSILYVAPTGAGKTVMLSDTILSHIKNTPDARVMWYAHRRELLGQAADTLRRVGLDVGVFGQNRRAPVQVISTQAVLARGEVTRCTLAAFDEAHHYAADLWGTVATTHKASGALIVGATATPERGDGRGLGHMFDGLVTVAQVKELVSLGALVPCTILRPRKAVPRGKVARTPASIHLERFRGKRNVVFAPHVRAAEDFAREFVANGVEARVVEGKTHETERAESLARFAAGDLEVVVNVMVLTEGWDCPPCEVVTIARDCGSTGMYLQIAGRGARPSPESGKAGYTLCDLRGVSYVHGRPDDDREYSLEGLGISRGASADVPVGARLCKTCGQDLGDAMRCERCGTDHAQKTPEDAGIELEGWRNEMRTEPVDKRVARLAKWLKEAEIRQHKPQTAFFRFRAVYGHFPTAEVRAKAERMMRSEDAAPKQETG